MYIYIYVSVRFNVHPKNKKFPNISGRLNAFPRMHPGKYAITQGRGQYRVPGVE